MKLNLPKMIKREKADLKARKLSPNRDQSQDLNQKLIRLKREFKIFQKLNKK